MNIWSLAKFQAFLFFLLGILAGVLYSVGGLIIDTLVSLGWIVTDETPGLSYGTFLAFGALIGMPVIFGLMGFMAGILEAISFNFFGRLFWDGKTDLYKDPKA